MISARLLQLRPAQIIGLAIFGLAGAAGSWLLFRFDPAAYAFYPVCFLHQQTGLQCPGCGSLRAMHQLLHGHVGAAWRFNPLLVICLPLLGALAVRYAVRKRNGADAWQIPPAWLWTSLGIGLVFGIARNLW